MLCWSIYMTKVAMSNTHHSDKGMESMPDKFSWTFNRKAYLYFRLPMNYAWNSYFHSYIVHECPKELVNIILPKKIKEILE